MYEIICANRQPTMRIRARNDPGNFLLFFFFKSNLEFCNTSIGGRKLFLIYFYANHFCGAQRLLATAKNQLQSCCKCDRFVLALCLFANDYLRHSQTVSQSINGTTLTTYIAHTHTRSHIHGTDGNKFNSDLLFCFVLIFLAQQN